MKKRLFCLVLCIVLCLSIASVTALAGNQGGPLPSEESTIFEQSEDSMNPDMEQTFVDLRIGEKEYYNITSNSEIIVNSLDDLDTITVLTQDGVDIEGMSENWSMSTTFLDSQNRGVLEVQVFDVNEKYIVFNLQSHYGDCPGAEVRDFQIMTITARLPEESVDEPTLGDVNGDGNLDMKDVLALRKYLASISGNINTNNADVNGDDSLDMKDVLMIRKYLANLIPSLGGATIV